MSDLPRPPADAGALPFFEFEANFFDAGEGSVFNPDSFAFLPDFSIGAPDFLSTLSAVGFIFELEDFKSESAEKTDLA